MMATHAEVPVRHPGGVPLRALVRPRRIAAGVSVGLTGGALMAAPIVLYDWLKAGHAALELPMATTGWFFGLDHFVQNGYRWWPIVIGAVLLIAYWILSGLAFAGLAGRVFDIKTLLGGLAGGFAWGIASFVSFWYVLLAIARDGAPFRATATSSVLVAPNWVWILGFVVSGLASGLAYRALGRRATS
jgi:hypothetical protein